MLKIEYDKQLQEFYLELSKGQSVIKLYGSDYYFVLDESNMPHKYSNGIPVFVKLIKSWNVMLATKVIHEESIFLPFSFEDEYIGGLRVKFVGVDEISIHSEFSTLCNGYSFSPLDATLSSLDTKLFEVISENIFISLNEFKFELNETLELFLKNHL